MRTRQASRAVGTAAALGLLLTACGAPDDDGTRGEKQDAASDCDTYSEYGTFDDETVEIISTIRGEEGDEMEAAWSDFAECVGIDIQHEGTGEMEAILRQRVDGGSAPDIAMIPQPGLMRNFKDDLVPAPDDLYERAQEGWTDDWLDYGTIDGEFYAAPHSGNAKSFVWYSPSVFEENDYEIPQTWDEMIALSDRMLADGIAPWCVGSGSDQATGWPITDWIEDVVLREDVALYDDWVTNDAEFTDPRIKAAFEKAGTILTNDDYVYGGTELISSTDFKVAALPILDGECGMHRQASFLGWEEDVDVSEDGDVFVFRFPETNEGDNRMLIGGEFVAAFDGRDAVEAVRMYLASQFYHDNRLSTGPWTTARQGVDPSNATTAVNEFATEIVSDPAVTVRFDGSDLMPGEVGASVYWEAVTAWTDGDKDLDRVLADVQSAWDELK
ncbi:ABC transporter substrate-binding protein [Salininema proteolyticum]|uniref:ABC transporter substrate-binding protein n=1 Tax=Salininema proteolyticum TaxID=1607685 RepID=A0ABV8U197_9ACTN